MDNDGVVLIDKPKDITSRKVLDRVMKILHVKRAGHFGSLDPFATGLLCIGIGQGTKLLPFLQDHSKEYVAIIGFDMSTDTDDITGDPIVKFEHVNIDIVRARAWIGEHTGLINQVPPDYCAQKVSGKPLYLLKRAKREVNPRPKQVFIERMEVLAAGKDFLKLRIVCSRGTYIRSIGRDIGAYLGYGGYLRELRRIQSEGFSLDDAVSLERLELQVQNNEAHPIPLAEALHLPKAHVTSSGQADICEGKPIQVAAVIERMDIQEGAYVALLGEGNHLLCVAKVQRTGGVFGYIERGFQPF